MTSSSSMAVVSRTIASSAGRSGLVGRLLSYSSRRRIAAAMAAMSFGDVRASCRARRSARSSGDAVRYTFNSASGATTVPISRPSTTMPPSPMRSRWAATSRRRTSGTADTALTAAVTCALRITLSIWIPSTATHSSSGSVPISRSAAAAHAATASASSSAMPSSSTAHVTARYIAPVSR